MSYEKQEWKDLPDKTTPVNATRMNKIESGIESNNILKNLYSNNFTYLKNLSYSNGTYTQQKADTKLELVWKIQAYNNESFVKTIDTLTNNSLTRLSMSFTKDDTFNAINFGLNGTSTDTTLRTNVSSLENGKTYVISWNLINNVQGSIAWNQMQIEESNNMTSYSNFAGVIIESGSNSNGSWIKYSDGTMICTGKHTFTGGVSTSLPNGGYRTSGQTIQFPINFSLAPDSVVASSLSDTNDNGFIINSAQVTKTSFSGFWWVVNSTYDKIAHSLSYIAIGRWR